MKVIVTTVLAVMTLMPARAARMEPGLAVGDPVPSYHPKHVAGPDRGTTTCPVC